MPRPKTVHVYVRNTPIQPLYRIVWDRHTFQNHLKTLRGAPVKYAEILTLCDLLTSHARVITAESTVELLADQPDYVMWSQGVPLAWHSTTRRNHGSGHAIDREWRLATLTPPVVIEDPTLRRLGPKTRAVHERNRHLFGKIVKEMNRWTTARIHHPELYL